MILPKIRDFAGASQDAAREVKGVSKAARLAAYAIRAVMAVSLKDPKETVRRQECEWQRAMLPDAIRELVLDNERLRNELCWGVFNGRGEWNDCRGFSRESP